MVPEMGRPEAPACLQAQSVLAKKIAMCENRHLYFGHYELVRYVLELICRGVDCAEKCFLGIRAYVEY